MNKLFAPLLLVVQIAGFYFLWQKIPDTDSTSPSAIEQSSQIQQPMSNDIAANILPQATIPELISSEGKMICSRDEECLDGYFCDLGRCEKIQQQHGLQCDLYTEKYGISVCGPFPCNDGRCRSCNSANQCPPSMVCHEGKCAIRVH